MNIQKQRIDQLLVEKGFVDSRSKAQALIIGGMVFVNEEKIQKAGTLVSSESQIRLANAGKQWVSRGAHKLLKALEVFPINPLSKVCMDVGASTGGFTEVLLSRGALKVYAVDVGYGQLAWKLRNDPRVVVMERQNARYLKGTDFEEKIDLITVDASFISLKLLLPILTSLLAEKGNIIALLKPQFEAGKNRIGKKGVIRDPVVHKEIMDEINSFIESETELSLNAVDYSPIKGPKGNIEFLLALSRKGYGSSKGDVELLDDIVKMAHEQFDSK